MPTLLFIDFDGTLCHDRFWRGLPPDEAKRVQNFMFVGNKELVWDWMMGKYTAEEIHEIIAEGLGIDYKVLWNTFVNDCSTMLISPEVLKRIDALREKYFVILSTDNMDSFQRFTAPSLELSNYFDQIMDSHTLQKPKSDMFKEMLTKEPKNQSSHILIDNSPTTCEVFRSLGGTAYLVSNDRPIEAYLDILLPTT